MLPVITPEVFCVACLPECLIRMMCMTQELYRAVEKSCLTRANSVPQGPQEGPGPLRMMLHKVLTPLKSLEDERLQTRMNLVRLTEHPTRLSHGLLDKMGLPQLQVKHRMKDPHWTVLYDRD